MELEQIYNELYEYWTKHPGEKARWEHVFYRNGGIKDLIEKELLRMDVREMGKSEDAIDEAKEILRTMEENRIGV